MSFINILDSLYYIRLFGHSTTNLFNLGINQSFTSFLWGFCTDKTNKRLLLWTNPRKLEFLALALIVYQKCLHRIRQCSNGATRVSCWMSGRWQAAHLNLLSKATNSLWPAVAWKTTRAMCQMISDYNSTRSQQMVLTVSKTASAPKTPLSHYWQIGFAKNIPMLFDQHWNYHHQNCFLQKCVAMVLALCCCEGNRFYICCRRGWNPSWECTRCWRWKTYWNGECCVLRGEPWREQDVCFIINSSEEGPSRLWG